MARAITVATALAMLAVAAVWIATLLDGVRWDYTRVDRSADPIEVATTVSLSMVPDAVRLALTRIDMDRGRSLVTLDAYLPLGLTWREVDPATVKGPRWRPALARPPTVDTGFGRRSTVTLNVPLWLPLLATAAWPAHRLRRWSVRRRWPATACPRCGYDCRGIAGPCPECGRPGV